MSIGPIAQGLAGSLADYVSKQRDRQRQSEDNELDEQMKLIQALSNRPDANPALMGKAIHDLVDMQNAKGSQRKLKPGMAGFMGASELPISQLLTGLASGITPVMGNTTEQIPTGSTGMAGTVGPSMKGAVDLPGIGSVGDGLSPVPAPPKPMLPDIATRTQPVANQPMFRSPEEMATQAGNLEASKDFAKQKSSLNADMQMMRELGVPEAQIRETMRKKIAPGTSGNLSMSQAGVFSVPQADGTVRVIHAITKFDPTSGQSSTVDSLTGRPLPPNASVYEKDPNDPTSIKEYNAYKESELKAGRMPIPYDTSDGKNSWLTMDANRKRPTTNIGQFSASVGREFTMTDKLATDWKAVTKLPNVINAQNAQMQKALQLIEAQGTDRVLDKVKNPADQVILVTFQKILDPSSVVRESEYARSGVGQSVIDRIEGTLQKIKDGGTGMTLSDLKAFAAMAGEIAKQAGPAVEVERQRIKHAITQFGLDPKSVFGTESGMPDYSSDVPIPPNGANPSGSLIDFLRKSTPGK